MAIRDRPQFGNRLPPEKTKGGGKSVLAKRSRCDAAVTLFRSFPIRSRGPKRRPNASGRPVADSATAVSRVFAAEVSRRAVSCGDGSGLGRPYYNGDVQNLSRSCSTEIRIGGG